MQELVPCKQITELFERHPQGLSGGQRQRVAIGRAVVREARLFLFDEPLSNLDAQLRDEMRSEIKRLHQELGTTMIYVTHDQIEAMTLADRIVLLNEGRIEQQGAPLELFERPATRFVAGFLGSPAMNFVPATLSGTDDGLALQFDDGRSLALPATRQDRYAGRVGQRLVVGIRPEHLEKDRGGEPRAGLARLSVTIELVQPTGSRTYGTFTLGDTAMVAELQVHDVERPGEQLELLADMNRAVLIDPTTDDVI